MSVVQGALKLILEPIFEADFFDNVRHDRLLAKVAQRVDDADVMRLLKIMLKANGRLGLENALHRRKLIPRRLASIPPVQWVAWAVGGPVTSSTTRCTVAAGSGGLPGLRVLSRSNHQRTPP